MCHRPVKITGDISSIVNTPGDRQPDAARRVEHGKLSVGGPQETAIRLIPVIVESGHCPTFVDAQGEGTMAQGCARARGVKCGECSVGGPQKAVRCEACVYVVSRDRPILINSVWKRSVDAAR